ncbi:MAG TPA: hypothetical protein PLI43_07545 [Albidovulum sp.]|uniref:hypothetical protein n=1 Tax=Albidovulum sp. TaxID=1872424 RepID=UPI002BDE06A4|nr:hypothetical protein [Albidovulum sp.]
MAIAAVHRIVICLTALRFLLNSVPRPQTRHRRLAIGTNDRNLISNDGASDATAPLQQETPDAAEGQQWPGDSGQAPGGWEVDGWAAKAALRPTKFRALGKGKI